MSGDKLILQTIVQTVVPTFGIKAGFDSSFADAKVGTQEGITLYSNANVSDTSNFHAETIYVSVFQENECKYKGTFNLSVTASALEKDANNKTNVPNWFLQSSPASNSHLEVNFLDDVIFGTQEAKATITYKTGTTVEKNTELFSVAFAWRSNANLEPGTYSATIKLTYAAQ